MPHVYPRTTSLFIFLGFLSYSDLFDVLEFNLTFIQKNCVPQKLLFFSNKINFCRHEISFFYLKLFF